MKPKYEEIRPSFGSSFTYLKFKGTSKTNMPYWHFHPEYEIVFVSDGRGHRKVGGQVSEYQSGDLIFVGPNIPHLGFAQDVDDRYVEIVVQMRENFLGRDFFQIPEMAEVKKLFERAKSGLVFGHETKWLVGRRLLEMDAYDYFSKMTELLVILQMMAHAKDCTPLNVASLAVEVKQQDQERMQKLNSFIEKNYQNKFTLEEVAQEARMTVPSLCRFFKNLTHRTVMEYANEYRVAQATRMLSEKHLSISSVCYKCGFNNLSHFNKQFKAITGQTPTAYRKNIVNFVQTGLEPARR